MTAAVSQQTAPRVHGHPNVPPRPLGASTGAARPLPRDASTGRFTPRPVWPTCTECGAILAENLLGELRCLRQCCENYRLVVDVVPGVELGVLTAEMLEPSR